MSADADNQHDSVQQSADTNKHPESGGKPSDSSREQEATRQAQHEDNRPFPSLPEALETGTKAIENAVHGIGDAVGHSAHGLSDAVGKVWEEARGSFDNLRASDLTAHPDMYNIHEPYPTGIPIPNESPDSTSELDGEQLEAVGNDYDLDSEFMKHLDVENLVGKIMDGHAMQLEEHDKDFPSEWSHEELKDHLVKAVEKGERHTSLEDVKPLPPGKEAYWLEDGLGGGKGTIVIENPSDSDGGTFFRGTRYHFENRIW